MAEISDAAKEALINQIGRLLENEGLDSILRIKHGLPRWPAPHERQRILEAHDVAVDEFMDTARRFWKAWTESMAMKEAELFLEKRDPRPEDRWRDDD